MDIRLDRSRPLPSQIVAEVRQLVSEGVLRPGDSIPSTRNLATMLGVSRGTVTTAYDQLAAEGYLQAKQGSVTRIHEHLGRAVAQPARRKQQALPSRKLISLAPSTRAPFAVRSEVWRAAWREAAAQVIENLEPAGEASLREAIADHLRLARSMNVSAEDVLVTGGTREGLMLILLALAPQNVGVEDPGHTSVRDIVELLGPRAVPCPTDTSGVIPDLLPDVDILILSPSHLYPEGRSMPIARRTAVLEEATRRGIVVVEDDYNAEIRSRVAPLPTLASMHVGQVITAGTFSTLLSPNLSAGYVVAPPEFAESLLATRSKLGMPVAGTTQLAIAHLLRGGYVRRHTRTLHALWDRRRSALAQVSVPESVSVSHTFGVDYVLRFPTELSADRFEEVLRSGGFEATRLAELPGFVMSFAHLNEVQFEHALKVLRYALGKAEAFDPGYGIT